MLCNFRETVVTYFNNTQYSWQADGSIENDDAKNARTQINLMIDEIHDIIILSGNNPVITWTPPPAIGGFVQNIDFVANIFNLSYYRIPPDIIIDHIERAIGVYQKNSRPSFIRTINPFFWIGLALDYFVEIPFSLLGKAGFNSKKIEDSPIGKLVKTVLYLTGVFASFLTILQLTGYLDEFNMALNRLLRQ